MLLLGVASVSLCGVFGDLSCRSKRIPMSNDFLRTVELLRQCLGVTRHQASGFIAPRTVAKSRSARPDRPCPGIRVGPRSELGPSICLQLERNYPYDDAGHYGSHV
jgi:hypothetical protein